MHEKEPYFDQDENILRDKLLTEIKKNYNYSEIINILGSLKQLKVLVLGDAIIDEYAYTEILDRAKKEPVLVFKYKNSRFFTGGILAIANHIAEFCDNVTLATCIGNDTLIKNLIKEKMNKKIKIHTFLDNEEPTLIKKRYIESYWNRKLFEIYNKGSTIFNLPEKEILRFLENNIDNFDIVIVGDFGHGLINDKIQKLIIDKTKYLSINVQTNSGNLGFNLITKINKANFISLTHEELQLAMHNKTDDLYKLTQELGEKIDCKKICVTLGKEGILYYDNGSFYYCPVFSKDAVDTIGAGDAVFSLVSLVSLVKNDPILIPFLGNCVGALAIKIVGNERPVRYEELSSFIGNIFN